MYYIIQGNTWSESVDYNDIRQGWLFVPDTHNVWDYALALLDDGNSDEYEITNAIESNEVDAKIWNEWPDCNCKLSMYVQG